MFIDQGHEIQNGSTGKLITEYFIIFCSSLRVAAALGSFEDFPKILDMESV